jgi:hypothetical protein
MGTGTIWNKQVPMEARVPREVKSPDNLGRLSDCGNPITRLFSHTIPRNGETIAIAAAMSALRFQNTLNIKKAEFPKGMLGTQKASPPFPAPKNAADYCGEYVTKGKRRLPPRSRHLLENGTIMTDLPFSLRLGIIKSLLHPPISGYSQVPQHQIC